jgi:hypothetical protein
MNIEIYLILSTIMLGLLGLVWRHNDWPNFFIKAMLLGLGGCGLFLNLKHHGYIVKAKSAIHDVDVAKKVRDAGERFGD